MKGHLDLPFLPGVSTIGGHIQAINKVVEIRDQIVLSNRHVWRFREDCDISAVSVDRSADAIDLLSQERVGYVQVLNDPDFSAHIILPKTDAQVRASVP